MILFYRNSYIRVNFVIRTMSSVKSYIFLDLETTGLPFKEFGETKVTELTMTAVLKDHFLKTPFNKPRVLNKITLCINPKKYITEDSSAITGLTNELLDDLGAFDEKLCDSLISFIERVPQPACLIAHNGERFDFPILQSHLKILKKSFPESLMIADTLKAFRDLKVMEKDPQGWAPEVKLFEDLDDIDPNNLIKIIEEVEQSCKENTLFNENKNMTQHFQTPEKQLRQNLEFVTPVKSRRKADVRLEVTPNSKVQSNYPPSSGPKCRKSLFKTSFSYKLDSVYEHVVGQKLLNAHSSETDVMGLIDIVTKIGNPFHEWVSLNSKLFKNVLKMW